MDCVRADLIAALAILDLMGIERRRIIKAGQARWRATDGALLRGLLA